MHKIFGRCLTCTGIRCTLPPMKLQTYMEKRGVSDAELGQKIGKDRSLVSKYRRGKVQPSLDVIARIEAATSKAVTFRDFVEAAQ